MDNVVNIIYIITNIVRIMIVCKLGSMLLNNLSVSKVQKNMLILLYCVVDSAAYLLIKNSYVNIAANFLLYMIFTLAYDCSFYMRIFSFVVTYLLNILCEGGIYFALHKLNMPEDKTLILSFISIDIFLFILVEIIRLIYDSKHYESVDCKYRVLLMLIPLGNLYPCIYLLLTYDMSFANIFAIIMLFVVNVSIFFILNMITNTYEKNMENKALEASNKYYKNELQLIKQSNEIARTIKHNYTNHLITLKEYAKENGDKKIIDYIDSFLLNTKFESKLISTGNEVIDSLINYKLGRAKNIKYDIDIQIPTELFVSEYDTNILIGNLLDNALNALENTEEKYFEIRIRYRYSSLYIHFSNTYSGKLKRKGKFFATTNKDVENHGNGLREIYKIVKKYDGSTDFIVGDKCFTVDIIMSNN